uniref:Uncharacterized protein n=1 Tax=Anguilla anguilla TaxID=7936 RepID=A0A0E9WUM4_ANGAN
MGSSISPKIKQITPKKSVRSVCVDRYPNVHCTKLLDFIYINFVHVTEWHAISHLEPGVKVHSG